jgi:hypothetical protein
MIRNTLVFSGKFIPIITRTRRQNKIELNAIAKL